MAKEPKGLSTLLKGISKVATNPWLAALQVLLSSELLAIKPTNVGEQEWLDEQRLQRQMDQALGRSIVSSTEQLPQEDKITAFGESKKRDSPRIIRKLGQNLPSFKKGLSSLLIDEEILKNVLKGEDGSPIVIYRGSRLPPDYPEHHKDILKGEPSEGYATFLSDNPSVASSYSGDPAYGDRGVIFPYVIKPKIVIEYEDQYTLKNKAKPGSSPLDFDKFEFDRQAKNLDKGEVLIARNVVDIGPHAIRQGADDPLYWSYASDLYATKDPSILISAISKKKKGGGSVLMRNPYDYPPRAI